MYRKESSTLRSHSEHRCFVINLNDEYNTLPSNFPGKVRSTFSTKIYYYTWFGLYATGEFYDMESNIISVYKVKGSGFHEDTSLSVSTICMLNAIYPLYFQRDDPIDYVLLYDAPVLFFYISSLC